MSIMERRKPICTAESLARKGPRDLFRGTPDLLYSLQHSVEERCPGLTPEQVPGAAAVTGPKPMDNTKALGEEGGQETLHPLMGLSYDDR